MNQVFTFLALFLFSTAALAEDAPPAAQDSPPPATYAQPHAHSSGAELLYFCERTDIVVDQLRCDYYVQGVADLATIPKGGKPMACVKKGQSRSQLMSIALSYLQSVAPKILETESAASLILKSFQKAFPCPKNLGAQAKKKAAKVGFTPEMKAVFAKCASAGDEAAVTKCVDAGLKELRAKKAK